MNLEIDRLPASYLINRVKLHGFDSNEFVNTNNNNSANWHINELRPINLLTGENNSRKSRLLRTIYINDILEFESDEMKISDMIEYILETLTQNYSSYGLAKSQSASFINTFRISISNSQINYSTVFNTVASLISSTLINMRIRRNKDQVSNQLNSQIPELVKTWRTIDKTVTDFKEKVYIPLLRGLRPISAEDKDAYLTRTKNDYFDNNINSESIFTGLSLYKDLTTHLLGTHQQRETIKKYEAYLSSTFFEGQDFSLVPRIHQDVVFVKIGDSEREIFNLGDGIQSLIILTFKVFTATSPTMFFIEEPEQHLHAGMQRALIEALSRFNQHMYFMTTHSNHLIDIAQEQDNIAVHRVANKSDGTASEITPLTNYSDALADLGVRASSVLLANCSVWVEGVTDKLYLRVYLEKFLANLENSSSEEEQARSKKLRKYQENLHYVFTEYQGSNITHWDFGENIDNRTTQTPANKLNNKIFLLADKDIEHKGDRVQDLKDKLGDKFYLLKWKEIENHIPFDILVKTAEKRWRTFKKTKNLKFNVRSLASKPKNFFQVKDKGIGSMLEVYVRNEIDGTRTGINKYFFKAESGTVKDKVKFCHTAIGIMQSDLDWQLTDELNDLCNAIWTHIEESN